MEYSSVYILGRNLEYIRLIDSFHPEVKGKMWLLDVMSSVLYYLDICEIEDEQTRKKLEEWVRKLKRTYKKGEEISKQDSEVLSKDADRWQDLVYKELCVRRSLEFQKGALNQKALVLTSEDKPSNIFEKGIWGVLPKIAKSDFSDAAKCLLIGAPTPATMVALRGIEAVIRKYYALKTGKRVANKNLGNIIKELKSVPKINKKLLDYIDYIRSEKRNIAQHPTKIFNQREAERIFMEIVSAAHDIHAEITRSAHTTKP